MRNKTFFAITMGRPSCMMGIAIYHLNIGIHMIENIIKRNTNQFTPYVMLSNWKPHKNIKLQEMQFCMFCIKRNYFACIALIFMFVHCLTMHEARITISWHYWIVSFGTILRCKESHIVQSSNLMSKRVSLFL